MAKQEILPQTFSLDVKIEFAFYLQITLSPVCTLPQPLFRHLVDLGCIKPLCDLLTLMDSKIVQVALNGLENILRLGELEAKRGAGINPYCALIEEAYGEGTHP